MPDFDLADFIKRAEGLDFAKLFQLTQEEIYRAENARPSEARKRKMPDRDETRVRYVGALKGLSFWMHSAARPDGAPPGTFLAFRPVAEALVA